MKKPNQKDVKDTRNDVRDDGKPITTKNKSFPNYRPPRDKMPDLQVLPKTLPQNSRATTIAAMAQGDLTEEQKAEGFDKYNFKIGETEKMPNSAFLDKSSPDRTL